MKSGKEQRKLMKHDAHYQGKIINKMDKLPAGLTKIKREMI